jgi:hypothetical protein
VGSTLAETKNTESKNTLGIFKSGKRQLGVPQDIVLGPAHVFSTSSLMMQMSGKGITGPTANYKKFPLNYTSNMYSLT